MLQLFRSTDKPVPLDLALFLKSPSGFWAKLKSQISLRLQSISEFTLFFHNCYLSANYIEIFVISIILLLLSVLCPVKGMGFKKNVTSALKIKTLLVPVN